MLLVGVLTSRLECMMAEMMMGMQNLHARINNLEQPPADMNTEPANNPSTEEAPEEETRSEMSFKMVYPWPAGRE